MPAVLDHRVQAGLIDLAGQHVVRSPSVSPAGRVAEHPKLVVKLIAVHPLPISRCALALVANGMRQKEPTLANQLRGFAEEPEEGQRLADAPRRPSRRSTSPLMLHQPSSVYDALKRPGSR